MADVPYQGKDIVSKTLTNLYKDKSFEVYGLKLPKIKAFLPTELPAIEANDRISDHLFLLEDDSIALVDYESKYLSENKVKYAEYATRILKHYFVPGKKLVIRIIVIYTCDVESAEASLDTGALVLHTEQVFLVKQDWDGVLPEIRRKIGAGEKLTNEEMMKLIILPLTKKGDEAKSEMIDQVIDVTTELRRVDDEAGTFALAAMSVALVNYTSPTQKARIKEVLSMTDIGAMFEKEKEDAVALTKAKAMVDSVERVSLNGNFSIEEACRLLGITKDAYDVSRKYLEDHTEKDESVAV